MGMFDEIQVNVPLPDGWVPRGTLQTKDLNNFMQVHILNVEGRLLFDVSDYEEVPLEQRPFPYEKGKQWFGSLKKIPKYEDSNYHGYLHFYGIDDDGDFHEYRAKFTDGNLVDIKVVNDLKDV